MHTVGRQVWVGVSEPYPPAPCPSLYEPQPPAQTTPVIPAAAAPMRVAGQVGREQETGMRGLAPGALAGVGKTVVTGQAPGGGEQGQVKLCTSSPKLPTSPLPGPRWLTGCRVGDTPLGSSGHPDSGPAGCMQHPLCGWCSDATHRRGPRELKKELESSLAIYLGIHKQLLPSPAPPHRPPLQAPFPPPLPVSPDFLLQPMASMGSAFPAPTPFWGKEPLCLVQLQLMDP